MEESCRSGDLRENPALAAGVLKYIASEKYGAEIEVTMPYRDRLFSVSQWYSQLLGESLGKKYSRTGGVIHYGRTPVSSVGTTDMHSLTQEHQEGKKNKILQFLEENYIPDLRENIVAEHYIDPLHFRDVLGSYKGAAFSVQPILTQSAWFRPHNQSEEFDNLYFVGAGTHPGVGVPGVLSSSKIVDDLITNRA